MQGKRFRYMFTRLGYTAADVAKFLQVSERTVHNWVAGSVRVPHAAYKLLRIHLRYELPGDGWEGWHFSAGKLWTPEGHGLSPSDYTWWSLFIRRAELFGPLYRENGMLKAELAALRPEVGRPSGSVAARTLGVAPGDALASPHADMGKSEGVLVTPHFSLTGETFCPNCRHTAQSKNRRKGVRHGH